MSENLIDLTIILPTINECENLEKLIPQIVGNIDNSLVKDYEIIVVDDGSTDNTKQLIHNLNSKNENIKLFERKTQPSLPMAIYDGINKSNYEY